jgi:hypothetical protein
VLLARYTAADMPTAKTSSKTSSKTKSAKSVKKKSPAKKMASKKDKPDLAVVFAALRKLLQSFKGDINVETDKPNNYHTAMPTLLHRGKPLYFAGVKTGKNYVSYHLLPVYYNPDLNKQISPELKKRKQGMACFNFTAVDDASFAELRKLTALGLKMFKTAEFRRRLESLQ